MATTSPRGKLLRALPVLLIALLALFVAAQPVSVRSGGAVSSAAVCHPSVSSSPAAALSAPCAPAPPAETVPQPSIVDGQPVPADVAAVLASQFTAGVRGSRAPPVALV